MGRPGRKKVIQKKDGTLEVEDTDLSVSTLSDVTGLKLYIKGATKYYLIDVDETGDPTISVTDSGTTRPTDGIVIDG